MSRTESCRAQGSATGDHLIRGGGFAWQFLVEEVLELGLHLWNARRASDKDDLVHVLLLSAARANAYRRVFQEARKAVIRQFLEGLSREGA